MRPTCLETLRPGERDGESGGSPGSRPCNEDGQDHHLWCYFHLWCHYHLYFMNLNRKITKTRVLLRLSRHQLVSQKLCEIAHVLTRCCLHGKTEESVMKSIKLLNDFNDSFIWKIPILQNNDDDDLRGQLNREESINFKLMNILCQEM